MSAGLYINSEDRHNIKMYSDYIKGGQTVLHVTLQRGNTEIVKKLLEAGAENSEDNSKVLHIHNQIIDIVNLILYLKPTIIIPDYSFCLWGRNADIVTIFLERNVVKVDDAALYLAITVSGGHE